MVENLLCMYENPGPISSTIKKIRKLINRLSL